LSAFDTEIREVDRANAGGTVVRDIPARTRWVAGSLPTREKLAELVSADSIIIDGIDIAEYIVLVALAIDRLDPAAPSLARIGSSTSTSTR
jgi:hypothetical protein